MFWLIFITVISLSHGYVFWRATTVPLFTNRLGRRILLGAGLLLWLLFVSGMLYGESHDNDLARYLALAGMTWMGTLFLLTSSLLAVELVTGGGRFFPSRVKHLRAIALLVGLVLSALALYQGNRPPVVDDYTVEMANLPAELNGMVLVVMSDLHLSNLRREDWLAGIIAQVRELHPDLILMVGDIFEGHGQPPRAQSVALLKTLAAPLGVWGVPGNHEFYGGPSAIKALEDGGVRLLHDSWAEVRPGLILAGVEEHSFRQVSGEGAGLISKALANRPTGATILMSHKPRYAEEAAANGVQLMLSGHTHNGQLWPFNYLVKRFFPLISGRYTVNGLPVLVCRGTGTWGAPMRLWQTGEIMRVTLHSRQ